MLKSAPILIQQLINISVLKLLTRTCHRRTLHKVHKAGSSLEAPTGTRRDGPPVKVITLFGQYRARCRLSVRDDVIGKHVKIKRL